MARHSYTNEQILKLESNPYVYAVNGNNVAFTVEFREHLIEELKKPGVTSVTAFRKAGFGEDVFDNKQIYKFSAHICEEYRKKGYFSRPAGKSKEEKLREFAEADLSKMKQDEAMKELQKRMVRLEESVEFLKKISVTSPPG